jgi:hypothetical protein
MILGHHLYHQVNNEAPWKKSAACICPKSCMQELCITYFVGQRGRILDGKSILKQTKNTVIHSSRQNVLGAISDLDAQSLTFQESLRLAVLAEVEVRLMDARAHLM